MSDISDAKEAAWQTVLDTNGRSVPREYLSKAFTDAQMQVVRTLLSRLLPDGEVGFWRMVEEEVRK